MVFKTKGLCKSAFFVFIIIMCMLYASNIWAAEIAGESTKNSYPQHTYKQEIKSAILNDGRLAFYLLKCTVNKGDNLLATDFVSFSEDMPSASVNFLKYPDFQQTGKQDVILQVIYNDGTQIEITTQLTVIQMPAVESKPGIGIDDKGPVFSPILNLYAKVNTDIDYFTGVNATDGHGPAEITVDSSNVDPTKPGRYNITYTATGQNGSKKTEGAYISLSVTSPQTVYDLADRIIENAASGDLSQYEKARALYNWVINNIRYVDGSPHISAIDGAYTAFTLGRGDCFVFYAAVEVLYTRAGIPNVQVRRLGGATHFWNLVNTGDGWYHVDATPFTGGVPRVRFMFSESTAQHYTRTFAYANYNYDTSLYPEAAWE